MDLPVIESRQNRTVKTAAELGASANARREAGMFLAEGARLCEDAAKSGLTLKTAFFTEEALAKYADYAAAVIAKAEDSYIVKPHVAELLSQTKHTQGVFCVCEMPHHDSLSFTGKYLVLENVQDPSNLGAVMRTAEAVGISAIILTGGGCDVFSPKVLRASMGAAFRIRVFELESSLELIEAAKQESIKTFASVSDANAASIRETVFPESALVFIGNEGNGLPESTIAACDERITIPMSGRAESLNAAAAAAIIIWEMTRG